MTEQPFDQFVDVPTPGSEDDFSLLDGPADPSRDTKAARAARPATNNAKRPRLRRAAKQDIADSIRSLAMMLTVQRGELAPVRTLAQQYAGTKLGQAYENIADALAGGSTLADALAQETIFPPVVRRLAVVGAATGNPGPHLTKAADLVDQSMETAGKVRSAILEPAILGVCVVVFFIAMVTWAVPQMVDVFASTGAPVPTLSKIAMLVANIMQVIVPIVAVFTAVFTAWWFKAGRHHESLRYQLDKLALRIPIIGPLRRDAALANSLSILAALTDLGIAETEALVTAAAGCDNRAIGEHLRQHSRALTTGQVRFADVADGQYIPLPIGTVLAASADSGKLPMGLEHVAETYRRTSRMKAENLSTVLGPAANIIVGVVFALAVIVIYVPMYSMFTAMSSGGF